MPAHLLRRAVYLHTQLQTRLENVQRHLEAIGSDTPCPLVPDHAEDAAEEQLRWLMVRALPRVRAQKLSPRLQRKLYGAFAAIESRSVDEEDWRFFDAWNVYYEIWAHHLSHSAADDGLAWFCRTYLELLEAHRGKLAEALA